MSGTKQPPKERPQAYVIVPTKDGTKVWHILKADLAVRSESTFDGLKDTTKITLRVSGTATGTDLETTYSELTGTE